MIKIKTETDPQELFEVAQEYPYPCAAKALAAIRAGEPEKAAKILEEFLEQTSRENSYKLWEHLNELIWRVILWRQLPENEKEGAWLAEIDDYREEVLLLLYQQPDLKVSFEESFREAAETATEVAEIYLRDQEITIPTYEEVFETEYDWLVYKEAGDE